jgi:hypothetical protein
MTVQGIDKRMETVVNNTYFCINMELGHQLPVEIVD